SRAPCRRLRRPARCAGGCCARTGRTEGSAPALRRATSANRRARLLPPWPAGLQNGHGFRRPIPVCFATKSRVTCRDRDGRAAGTRNRGCRGWTQCHSCHSGHILLAIDQTDTGVVRDGRHGGVPLLPSQAHLDKPLGVALGEVGAFAFVADDVEQVLVLADLEIFPAT